ncbi:MAG: PDZ domain-containing protein [Planctomycetes bacterium]|nr:PDZ domain-containing protein [Planctomycetota bacterium]
MNPGYYRYPTIAGHAVAFVSEDDLWSVPAAGGVARRLTSNLGAVARPHLSRDGKWLAFTGTEEGHSEVYVMPADGGPARRLTWVGHDTVTLGWDRDGRHVVFASNVGQPFLRPFHLYTVPLDGGPPARIPVGPAEAISHGPRGGVVIGRAMGDPARWKRYRGGTTGDLWVDEKGKGDFRRLIKVDGNLAWPMWIGARVYFVSDHSGTGNLWSCTPAGADLRRETRHPDFYVRFPGTDGRRIVYQCGADLWILDPAKRKPARVPVEYHSPRIQRQRKFADAPRNLEDFALHPEGHSAVVTARGQAFAMGFWEGPVTPVGPAEGVRRRLTRWLRDGKRFLSVSDAGGDEAFELHAPGAPPKVIAKGRDIGRVLDVAVSPARDEAAFSNHRYELFHLDIAKGKLKRLDRSAYDRIAGISWAPDGRWIAYGFNSTRQTSQIRIAEVKTGKVREVTSPDFRDYGPSFDPDGKYLYFLSYRVLDPVYDAFYFDLGFPRGTRPYLATLRKDVTSPFVPLPKPVVRWNRRLVDQPKERDPLAPVEIDFDGIGSRLVTLPVGEGRYGQIFGMRGKVAYTNYPVEGSLGSNWAGGGEPPAKGSLEIWDYDKNKAENWVGGVTEVRIAGDLRTFAVRSGNRIRIVGADEKPKDGPAEPGRDGGWLELGRIRVPVSPEREWEQMLREAWRLQRDHYWREDMSGVDWKGILARYRPLLDRVSTRGELSDLIWEMQGELRTSHCYEIGGDYRWPPQYRQGFLGADFERARDGRWRIARLVRGDSWDPDRDSPLARPGVNARPGEAVVAVNGQAVGKGTPAELLVNRAGQEVSLDLENGKGKRRTVTVRTLREEFSLRYRAWVEANRAKVHRDSAGRVGYVHIPNMGPPGYAEFHRYYFAEVDRPGLLVDLRNNGGGHVSQLLLEKLARRRLGYDVNRWGAPAPYPSDAPMGPMVALTNEYAGSDGDIFSHCFKLMKLGPLVGKRTWGGVVGIWPRHSLVDGCVTTQPEFSFWFHDVGYGVENYGTDPDIEVENRPQDHVAGKDPQLDRALAEVERLLRENPPLVPEFAADGEVRKTRL